MPIRGVNAAVQGYYENHRDQMESANAWHQVNDHFLPHFHSSVELCFVLSGELRATIDGKANAATENTMIICSSYAVHSYETPDSSEAIFAIIPLSQVPSLSRQLHRQSFAHALVQDDEEGTLGTLMRLMVRCNGSGTTMKGLCYAVLGQLIERVGLVPAREGSRSLFVRNVLEYLQAHHQEPQTAMEIAAHFGYSRSHFSHLFSAHLGCSLAEYIASLRCDHAARLLRETDMRVADVAMTVGFESLRTFHRAFKKQHNMTPNRYAKT